MLEYLKVGTIVNVHGVHGEVKVIPETDDPNRFKKLKKVFLVSGGARKQVEVRGVKISNKFVILKLEGLDDRDAANLLRGTELEIERKDAVKLPEDTYFIGDLIGCRVVEENGNLLGKVEDVIPGAGCDVYDVYDEQGKNIMIPALADVILKVDVAAGEITVRLLPGLREVYS
ncbi:MAG: 16S rRNA processing protein RimM [Clostridia bacterium]|nr:16S rRNA processing protein RimM [Clostridia bacterium]